MEAPDDEARRRGWRFVWRLIVRERRGVIGAIAGGLLWQGAVVVTPLAVEQAVDEGIVPKHTDALLLWCGVLVLLGFLEAAGGGIRHLYAIRNRAHADAAVRDVHFALSLPLEGRFRDRVGAGEFMSRA